MALLEFFFYFERCNERDCEVTFGTMSMTKYVVEVSWKAVGTYKQPFMVESFKESYAKLFLVTRKKVSSCRKTLSNIENVPV